MVFEHISLKAYRIRVKPLQYHLCVLLLLLFWVREKLAQRVL